MIRIFAGYDPNEAAGYHTCCHSVMTRASEPVSITPIIKNTFPEWHREGENNGATEFSFSRFLVPYLAGYRGHAIFVDGADMLCLGDIAELWSLRSHKHAVQVVKRPEYHVESKKMWDQPNRLYPRKNWSSVMIMNCEYHHAHNLTPETVAKATGAYLHQFYWTTENRIGDLPPEWNFLVGHDQKNNPNKMLAEEAKILHFTNGLPDVHPTDGEADNLWRQERSRMNHITPV
jgi:lipopolysaccharide biosynthesis glycosyltransferase